MVRRRFLLAILIGTSGFASAADAPVGLQPSVVFTDYSPLSRDAELLRRLVNPLIVRRADRAVAKSGAVLHDQDVDLAKERFALYVPAERPAQGYALMVFIPPWPEAAFPHAWIPALDRHGMILVTAAHIDNDASMMARRLPMALLAARNVVDRYPVDPERVYVGGFSGGARVALRLAVGYPDLFRGGLIDASSDTLGDAIPLPPADLFRRFQDSSRLVYLTGDQDDFNVTTAAHSRRSMEDRCVYDIDEETMPHVGHTPPDAAAFNHALDELEQHRTVDPAERDRCRAEMATEIDGALRRAEALIAAGKTDEARAALEKIDARYGGLAAPRSLELADRLDGAR
jgi:dienelactone hydrolase